MHVCQRVHCKVKEHVGSDLFLHHLNPCMTFILQACFALGKYSEALTSFKAGQTLCSTEQINSTRGYDTWIQKCEVELHDEKGKQKKQQVFKQTATSPFGIQVYICYCCYPSLDCSTRRLLLLQRCMRLKRLLLMWRHFGPLPLA